MLEKKKERERLENGSHQLELVVDERKAVNGKIASNISVMKERSSNGVFLYSYCQEVNQAQGLYYS